jgi:hypothetical protein
MTGSSIIVPCEGCGSEGRIPSGTDWDGDARWWEECRYCHGAGGEEIAAEPITQADAEFLAAAGNLEGRAP